MDANQIDRGELGGDRCRPRGCGEGEERTTLFGCLARAVILRRWPNRLPMTNDNAELRPPKAAAHDLRLRIRIFIGSDRALNGYHSTRWTFHAGVQVIGPGRFRFAKYPFAKPQHQRVRSRFQRCHQKISKHGRPANGKFKRAH
jgi:hypothetical protein